MDFKDYYNILEVDKNATAEQIKKQYRKLARKYHPDVNKSHDAESRFKELVEAYEVLKDPEKRKLYDQYGADWKSGKQEEEYRNKYREQYQKQHEHAGYRNTGGFTGAEGFGDAGQFSDFFESLFGGSGKGSRYARQTFQQRGEDIEASIQIPIMDAYNGATRRVNFSMQSVSSDGKVANIPKSLNIKIPKGIKNGQKIRLAGQGSPGYNGAENGDMLIKIEFEKHPFLRAEGSDVYMDLPVAPWEAILGNTINVPAPGGTVKLKVPPDSYQGRKLRLKGKGIPSKEQGDLYVVINIILPPADNQAAKKIYEDMKELNFNPRSNMGG